MIDQILSALNALLAAGETGLMSDWYPAREQARAAVFMAQGLSAHLDTLEEQRIELLTICKALLGIILGRKELREKWPHCIEQAKATIAKVEEREP